MSTAQWFLVILALLAFFGQAVAASSQKSASYDEQFHLIAGYTYLRTGELRLHIGHPPLLNLLSALPLLVMDDIQLPLDHRAWAEAEFGELSDLFLWRLNDRPQEMLVLARLPLIMLGTLLVALLFIWARASMGPWAGWAALVLATFDPNLLTNSRLVTTDFGLTFFLTLSVWLFWRWQKKPSPLRLVLTGIAVGLTMASKFTGLLIWPALLLILLLDNKNGRRPLRLVADLAAMALVAYAVIWAVYGFEVGPLPNSPLALPIPAPTYPASVWDVLMVIEEQPRTAYLLGMVSERGWWYYFPVALAVKTPLPLLLLAGLGILLLVRAGAWRRFAVFWVPPLLYLALAMTGRLTIGYRHILPVVPFLVLLAGYAVSRLAAWAATRSRPALKAAVPALVGALLLWHAAGALLLFPHQEAFFNEVAGGPANGDRFLVDSNLDWGQDLLFLRELLAEKGIDEVYLSYFGTGVPEAYGVHYKPLPSFMRFVGGAEVDAYNPYTPPPGWYAISVTSLHLGLFYQNTDIYAYFRDKEPVASAGYSIRLYRVDYPPSVEVQRSSLTGTAVADMPPAMLDLHPDARLIVKWTATPTTEVWPAGREHPLPAGFRPQPADFEDAFRLLGYELPTGTVAPGETLPLTLFWQVGTGDMETPRPTVGPPLAAFVHLSGEDPAQIAAQYDGWETALTGLEPGDVIRHQLALTLPGEMEPGTYYLRTGLYSPQSGQRLSTREGEGDMVTLSTITVEPAE